MIRLDERGKQCPLPVIEAKRALEAAAPGEAVEVVVDNEIAVQNLKKLADHKGLSFASEKKSSREYVAVITAGEGVKEGESAPQADALPEKEPEVCHLDGRRKGTLLMKGFIYALTQQDVLPETILLYNGGAFLSCEGSDNLEDLKTLEAQGVEILTCGTCLNHYGIGDRLRVGSVTNMYEIAERMTGAAVLIRP